MLVSPCVSRCKILKRTGVCRGCGRTLNEIRVWRTADETEQAQILAELPSRAPLMIETEEELAEESAA